MRLIFTLFMAILIAPLTAQIVNSGFENWISFQGALLLQGWEIESYDGEPTVTQDLDSYEGMYAAKVEAIPNELYSFGNASTLFNISDIPPSLDFYVKASTELGNVEVGITFYNGEETVESFLWSSTDEEIPEWTFISIPLDQDLPEVTSARINISAQVGDLVPGSAVISVDKMSFGTTSGIDDHNKQIVNLYPNPASSVIRISEASEVEQMEIRDLNGKLVGRYSRGEVQHEISIQHLAPACYTVVALMKSGTTARQRLMISR